MISKLEDLIEQSKILDQFTQFFDQQRLEQQARASRLVERSTSRLNGQAFLMLNVFAQGSSKETSLEDQCNYLRQVFGINMKKQSLDERFNTYAVHFMRTCFTEALRIGLVNVNIHKVKTTFNRVLLTDATSFQLPASLATYYQSNGGDTSGSSIKIHQSYELLNGQIVDVQLFSGCENDNSYRASAASSVFPQPNDLYLADLGYFDLAAFRQIDQAGAYYLSRFRTRTSLYRNADRKAEEIDITDLLPQQVGQVCSHQVYAGKKHRLKTYLLVERVPDDVATQRLENLIVNARRNPKWQVSEERKLLCNYNLYLTNAPETLLPAEECRAIYHLRWQIEILFKIWKSIYGIDQVKKMSIFRFECYLFGKLIALLLSQHIQQLFRNYIWKMEAVEMSEWKSMKIMKRNWQWLRDCLLVGTNSVKQWFSTIFTMLFYTGRKESKKVGENHYRMLPLHKINALA